MSRRYDILRLENKLQVERNLQRKLERRRPWRVQFHALLGDHDGNVAMSNSDPRFVYVRREDRAVIRNVLNLRVANIANMPVLVGYSDEFPNRLQVLSIAGEQLGWSLGYDGDGDGSGGGPGFEPNHHWQHEFRRDGSGGHDVVWSSKQQIIDGLVYPPSSGGLQVNVHKFWYNYEDTSGFFAAETDALNTELGNAETALGAGTSCWVGIYLDTGSHELDTVTGDAFPTVLFPPESADSFPDWPAGSIRLAAVFLTKDDSDITWGELYDMRSFPASDGYGIVTPTDHSLLGPVHDDTATVDPTRGDIIVADSTPEWAALARGGAGAILNMDATGDDPEWLALGARGGILKVNAGATAVEYLAIGVVDTVLKSDGTDPVWGNVGHDELTDVNDDDHHNPVTLHADLNSNLLDLSTQDLDLDTQAANEVLAGPTSGADVKPNFRALVEDDIPTLSATKISGDAATLSHVHTHVINEDLTVEVDGAKMVFALMNEAQEGTTQVYENGVRQRLGDDYTETDMYNSVTFSVAPGGGSEVWIDYVPATG